MRSSTVFLVFIGLIVVVVLFQVISSSTSGQKNVQDTAATFMQAVHQNDLAGAERLLDTDMAQVMRAGNNITSISFQEFRPFQSAFTVRPETRWSFVELSELKIAEKVEPNVAKDPDKGTTLATVALTNGGKLYLRPVKGKWLVCYIARPEDER